MKRWNVTNSDGIVLKLYYKDLETAQSNNINSYITENTDYEYLEYVKKIQEKSIETLYDYKGRKVNKIPYNDGYILVRLYWQDDLFLDRLDYQRHDEHKFISPITWTCSNPKEFCELFIYEKEIELPIEIITLRELQKLKTIRFWNKDGFAFLKDINGYFYMIIKSNIPSKKEKAQYTKLNGNSKAVLVNIKEKDYTNDCRWFESEEIFLEYWNEFTSKIPTSFPTPSYQIKKIGYNLKHPLDREICFRLPYFNLDNEIKLECRNGIRNDIQTISHWVARKWMGLMQYYRQFGNVWENEEWVENLITTWYNYNVVK